ncbi:MAG: hypothetical protein ABJB10_08250, partial [Mesorhizobium sp.]
TTFLRTFTRSLAGGAVVVALCLPASAAGLGVSVGGVSAGASIGGSNGGLGVGAGVSVGGAGGVNAGVGATVGGTNGVTAGAGATVGGAGGVAAGAGASVGGTGGVTAGAGVGVGTTSPRSPNQPAIATPPAVAALAAMSSGQIARMKKRCASVLSGQGTYDRDLKQLCLLLARR